MKINEFAPILGELEKVRGSAKPVLVITHERPDGDAIGSLTGMFALLKENGWNTEFYLADPAPDFYAGFVPEMPVPAADTKELNEKYSMIVNVDASTVKRLGIAPFLFEGITIPFVTLDHHPDNGIFGDLSYVDADACSASEIVYEFAKAAKWTISATAATSLLLGITTDSGCFRFSNTTPRAHRAAAELLELGANHERIILKTYLSKPFNMAMFEAELLCRHLRTALDGRYAWFLIPQDVLKKYSIDIRNTEQLIENLRGIDGVTVAALIKPTASPGIFKISLRSKDPSVSAGRIARRLNGGGHEMAAGGTIFAKSAEEAEAILLKHVEQEINHE